MWHYSLILVVPSVSMNPYPSDQDSGVFCLNFFSLVLFLLPVRILLSVLFQDFVSRIHSLAWLHLTSTKKPQICKLNSGFPTVRLLCPMDDRPSLLRYSDMPSYSISKITSPPPVKDIVPSSWILYILSTGTSSFFTKQLRKLASSRIPSSPSILPVQMIKSQKISPCNEASTYSIFPPSLLKPLPTHP